MVGITLYPESSASLPSSDMKIIHENKVSIANLATRAALLMGRAWPYGLLS
jgi:hypothetical protein